MVISIIIVLNILASLINTLRRSERLPRISCFHWHVETHLRLTIQFGAILLNQLYYDWFWQRNELFVERLLLYLQYFLGKKYIIHFLEGFEVRNERDYIGEIDRIWLKLRCVRVSIDKPKLQQKLKYSFLKELFVDILIPSLELQILVLWKLQHIFGQL